MDLESGSNSKVTVGTKATTSLIEDGQRDYAKPSRGEAQHQINRESIARKYTAVRTQQTEQLTKQTSTEKSRAAFKASGDSENNTLAVGPSSGIVSTWESMKTGLQNLKSNIGAKKFLPLRQVQDTNTTHSRVSSSESLDEIFQRLKQPALDNRRYGGDDDDYDEHAMNVRKPGPTR
ncbi:hypothetical protein U1Q18_003033 [Sarracenia purpurea var. burkii]